MKLQQGGMKMLVVFIVLLGISIGSVIFPAITLVSSGNIRTPQPEPALQLVVALLMCILALSSSFVLWFAALAFLLASLAEDYWYYRKRFRNGAANPLPTRRMMWQLFIFSMWTMCVLVLYFG